MARQRAGRAPPLEVPAFLLPHYGASPVERFGIISLCTKHRMLRTEIVSTGTLDASLVHPREVFRTATMHRAAAIVLFHNHPSGDPTPSHDDVALTARLQEAGTLMGIDVLDHVFVAVSLSPPLGPPAGPPPATSMSRSRFGRRRDPFGLVVLVWLCCWLRVLLGLGAPPLAEHAVHQRLP